MKYQNGNWLRVCKKVAVCYYENNNKVDVKMIHETMGVYAKNLYNMVNIQ